MYLFFQIQPHRYHYSSRHMLISRSRTSSLKKSLSGVLEKWEDLFLHTFEVLIRSTRWIDTIKIWFQIGWNEMEMKMRNFVSFYNRAHSETSRSRLDSLTDSLGRLKHCRIVRLRNLHEIIHFNFWNNEHVSWLHWENIKESKYMLIFIYFVRRNFSSNDFWKKGGHNSKEGLVIRKIRPSFVNYFVKCLNNITWCLTYTKK